MDRSGVAHCSTRGRAPPPGGAPVAACRGEATLDPCAGGSSHPRVPRPVRLRVRVPAADASGVDRSLTVGCCEATRTGYQGRARGSWQGESHRHRAPRGAGTRDRSSARRRPLGRWRRPDDGTDQTEGRFIHRSRPPFSIPRCYARGGRVSNGGHDRRRRGASQWRWPAYLVHQSAPPPTWIISGQLPSAYGDPIPYPYAG
jgi:hypothetical protein